LTKPATRTIRIDWLVKNLDNNNGNVGVTGISFPGFYATEAALSGHPALKAVSPQAPVTDRFFGDDDHHNGVLFLMDAFDFHVGYGFSQPRLCSQLCCLQKPIEMQWR
jgi:predicted acyl esterase